MFAVLLSGQNILVTGPYRIQKGLAFIVAETTRGASPWAEPAVANESEPS